MVLLTWVTLSLAATGHLRRHGGRLAGDATDELDAAPGAQLLGRMQAAQCLDRRPRHVDRVCRPVDLRQDVAHPDSLEDRPDGATGDHTGALRRRLEEDAARAVD